MKSLIVTIDGPAASGKGTIARYIKKEFNFFHIDSGLLYRKIAKTIIEKDINIKNSKEINLLIKKTKDIKLSNSKFLRSPIITQVSSEIARLKKIRDLIKRILV